MELGIEEDEVTRVQGSWQEAKAGERNMIKSAGRLWGSGKEWLKGSRFF